MNFKTKPFAHQLQAFNLSKDSEAYALLMEQGTGKTKVGIDTAAHLYLKGEIDALLVIAPNGVHRNWIDDELPDHMAEDVSWCGMIYRSGQANNKGFKRDFDELIGFTGLAVLAINIDALITKRGKEVLKAFVRGRCVLGIVDESTDIKTPSAKRTRAARGLAKHLPYRRILTGTPTGNGNPLDLYSQFAFLDPDILGHKTYTGYKHEFANIETVYIPGRRPFPKVIGYKNLDKLKARIAPYSFRVTKDDALDLPPKLFQKRYFELSKEQARLYTELRSNFMAEMDGSIIAAPMVMTRMMRLQQISCGYVGTGDPDAPPRPVPGPNPRLDALKNVLEQYPGPTIIWCRFRPDIDEIMKLLGKTAVRYDGSVSEEDRAEGKRMFMSGEAEYFVGNPVAGGRGLTLHRAKNVVYYSNYFSYETRVQSEDRAHRIGLKHPVTYIDIIGEGTVDEKIVKSLREKLEISNLITGDNAREWI